jgi:predicted dehydrogenase
MCRKAGGGCVVTQPVRFALIGAGGIAQSYAAAFENHPDAKLAVVCDTREEAAKAMAERAVCPAMTSLEALLSHGPAFDAAIVSTPPNTHESIALALVEKKIHVLCEKPFTLSAPSAQRMIAAANAGGVRMTMASKFRYSDDMIKLKSLVASGVLGELLLVENAFTSRVDMGSRWNANASVAGGGVLIDNGTHSVDILRYILGPIVEVKAVQFPNVQKLGVEDTVQLFVRCKRGIPATVDLSWSINKELDYYLNVYGTHGTAFVGWRDSKYRQHSARDWITFGKGYDKLQAFRDELGNFARAVRDGEKLLIAADDALASVEVIEAAYRSLREPHWATV